MSLRLLLIFEIPDESKTITILWHSCLKSYCKAMPAMWECCSRTMSCVLYFFHWRIQGIVFAPPYFYRMKVSWSARQRKAGWTWELKNLGFTTWRSEIYQGEKKGQAKWHRKWSKGVGNDHRWPTCDCQQVVAGTCLLSQHINPRTNTLTNQKAGYLRSYFNFLSCSKAPEEAHALAQAGLVVDWVKSKRLLVLVRCLRY